MATRLERVPQYGPVGSEESVGQVASGDPAQFGCLVADPAHASQGRGHEHDADELSQCPAGVAMNLGGGVAVDAQQSVDASLPAGLLAALPEGGFSPRLARLDATAGDPPRVLFGRRMSRMRP